MMKLGILIIRLMVGLTFIIHGAQKIWGGFEEPMQMMQSLGLPAFLGILLGIFEFIGGILIFVGIFTNFIATLFIFVMLGALFIVHLPQGYMASEFVMTLIIMNLAIILSYKWKKLIQLY